MRYEINETKRPPRMVDCKICGCRKEYHAKDMCEGCYNNVRKARTNEKKDFQFI